MHSSNHTTFSQEEWQPSDWLVLPPHSWATSRCFPLASKDPLFVQAWTALPALFFPPNPKPHIFMGFVLLWNIPPERHTHFTHNTSLSVGNTMILILKASPVCSEVPCHVQERQKKLGTTGYNPCMDEHTCHLQRQQSRGGPGSIACTAWCISGVNLERNQRPITEEILHAWLDSPK